MKVKCFLFFKFDACCGSAAEESKAVFIKNGDSVQDARDIP